MAADPVPLQVTSLARATDGELRTAVTSADDPRIRAYALGLLSGRGADSAESGWIAALADTDPRVRRRAAELAPTINGDAAALLPLLDDDDVTVLEATAWALGELEDTEAVPALVAMVTNHDEPLAREAAVAALGAIGDDRAVPAILAACHDVATVRRRAVLALAPFDGPEVDAALHAALTDRDWQTRQAAEDLLGEGDQELDEPAR